MPSELGQGRPQDWPDEMYALANRIREATNAARERGGPVVLPRSVARDVSVGLNVGGDALKKNLRRSADTEEDDG